MAATRDIPTYGSIRRALGLRPGELVRVRSAFEIAPTLDTDGSLDGMPFMPEMVRHCGQTFRVSRRADKTCAGDGAVRRMHDAVHLEDLRCDGAAHGGCEAACLLFWKEAWLERVEDEDPGLPPDAGRPALTEHLLETTTLATPSSEPLYRCQATEIPNASTPLRYRELDQYVRDVRNWGLGEDPPGLDDRGVQPLAGLLPAAPAAAASHRRRALISVPAGTATGREGGDAGGDVRPPTRRAGADQEQGRDRGDPRPVAPQSRTRLRSRDGPVLRPDGSGPRPRQPHR